MSKAKNIEYYDPSIILSKKDLDGLVPSIYIVTTNRSAGKTTSFLKMIAEEYINNKKEFCLIYRYKYELSDSYKLFDDLFKIYPELGGEMKAESIAEGLIYKITYNNEQMGFAVALSNVDNVKKYSPLFANVQFCLMDEYQTESGKYLANEVKKFQSMLMTISRGGGSQSRNIKVFLLGNLVTIMNPYLIAFDIHKRLREGTKFIRGTGWVAEFGFNKAASDAIKNNRLFAGFKDDSYIKYSTENVYLHDATAFIEKPKGAFKYICTIVQDGQKFGVRSYWEQGIVYINKKPDNNFKYVITFKNGDHNQNTVMLNHYSWVWKNIKDAYFNGALRFDDMKTKSVIFDILAVDIYK